jgi:hypothetical protein
MAGHLVTIFPPIRNTEIPLSGGLARGRMQPFVHLSRPDRKDMLAATVAGIAFGVLIVCGAVVLQVLFT